MTVRGIRDPMPAGTVLARMGSTAGAPQPVPIAHFAKAIGGAAPTGAAFGQIADGQVVANVSGVSNVPVGIGVSALLDKIFGNAQGDVLYRDAAAWKVLAPGIAGQALITGGPAVNPAWGAVITSGNFVDAEIPVGLVNGVNVSFALANTPSAGSVHLYLNGLRMRPTTDFSISGSTLTYTAGATPQTGDNHYVDYRK